MFPRQIINRRLTGSFFWVKAEKRGKKAPGLAPGKIIHH
jgi:hypothetical protein